jgi:hypothetical protein
MGHMLYIQASQTRVSICVGDFILLNGALDV